MIYSEIKNLIVDISALGKDGLLSCWRWILGDINDLIVVSKMGDMFLKFNGDVYWLAVDACELTKIANSIEEFGRLLANRDNLDNWFMPVVISQLESAGKMLQQTQVYSYIKLPIIGGEYSLENIEVSDLDVHFAISGQIAEQIRNLPDGTHLNIKLTD